MAEPQGTVFGAKATEQIAKTVREVSRRMMNEQPHRGRWQNNKGSGGGHQIWFTIDSVYCADSYDDWHLVVTATHYTKSCVAIPPDANDDGTYNIYDICNIHGYYTDASLIGTVGRATYFYPLTGTCTAKWLLDTLCVQPECA